MIDRTEHKRKKRRNLTLISRLSALAALVAEVLLCLTLLGLTRFSSLSRDLFLRLNLVALLVMLGVNLLIMLAISRRSAGLLKLLLCLTLLLSLAGAGALALERKLSGTLDKIIAQPQESELLESVFVVAQKEAGSVSTVQQLDGKTVGILADDQSLQGSVMPQREVDNLDLEVQFVRYDDYAAMIKALSNQEIDAAALPQEYTQMFENTEDIAPLLSSLSVVHRYSRQLLVQTEAGSDKDVTSQSFTVLIIGVDDNRSDALILATVNPLSMDVLLTSIPRDSYVSIACGSGKANKINAARTYGRQCTIDTVEALLDVNVDFFFESNFEGIIDIVDALGGVIITNPKEFVGQDASEERGHQTVWVPEGTNRLNGEQALAFARERHTWQSGDFQRQSNQQQVIQAILTEAVRLRDVDKALKVLDAAGENVTTNFSIEQLITLFNLTMQKMDRSYVQNQNVVNLISSRLSGVNGRSSEGLSVVWLYQGSVDDCRQAIHRKLNLQSEVGAAKSLSFSINWVYTPPVISAETYDNDFVSPQDSTVLTMPNFVGRPLSEARQWAQNHDIELNVRWVEKGDRLYDEQAQADTVLTQSVSAGAEASGLSQLTLNVQAEEE